MTSKTKYAPIQFSEASDRLAKGQTVYRRGSNGSIDAVQVRHFRIYRHNISGAEGEDFEAPDMIQSFAWLLCQEWLTAVEPMVAVIESTARHAPSRGCCYAVHELPRNWEGKKVRLTVEEI